MPNPLALLRPDLPPPSPFTVTQAPHRAKLDQNESPYPLPSDLEEQILAETRALAWHRYPQPARYLAVKERFAAAVGLAPERLALTVGGDQAIYCAFAAAGGPGRLARVFEPTYPMLAHYARATHTRCERVVLGPDHDVAAHGLGGDVDLLCLVSPNNPTGTSLSRAFVEEALSRRGLVLLDEAYADYAGESHLDLVARHHNLFVARSLSKAMLAGVRLGYLVGHPEIVAAVERLLFAPYHLNALQLAVASCYSAIAAVVRERAARVVSERDRVRSGLEALGLTAFASRANFVLFAAHDAATAFERLAVAGVRIRNVSSLPGLSSHLRVTVGTPEENDLFLAALPAALASSRG